jgi:outer membrane protein assembly factor BamA
VARRPGSSAISSASTLFLQNASFFGLPVRSGLFATLSRDRARFDGEVVSVTDIASISFEQRWRRQRLFEVAYGYRFESNHTFDPNPLPGDQFPLDDRANIARLNAAAFADRRDDPVNATRGTFSSLSIEQAVRRLGSDARYGKVFAQQQVFVPLGPMVLATRLLAGHGYGPDDLIPSDRFYAGGGNSVRGYAENGLGPRSFFGDPSGGSDLLIVNQELRMPVYKWISALGFVDAGNAFDDESPFAFRELKVGYGLGLRVASPIGLIRLDFGVPGSTVRTSSRSANQLGSGRWYFGLGHIF